MHSQLLHYTEVNVTCSSTPFGARHRLICKISHTVSMISRSHHIGARSILDRSLIHARVYLSVYPLGLSIRRVNSSTRIPFSPHHDQIVNHSILWLQNHQGKLLSLANIFLLWLPLVLSFVLGFHAQRFQVGRLEFSAEKAINLGIIIKK